MANGKPLAFPRRRLVVGVDGSPNSLAALRRAVRQADAQGLGLDIVYVIPVGSSAQAEASGYEMLDELVRAAAPQGLGVPAERLVAQGEPARTLVALSDGAERLIIGARLNSEYGNLLGGDVVPYCLAHTGCPVDVCADHGAGQRRDEEQAKAAPAAGGV